MHTIFFISMYVQKQRRRSTPWLKVLQSRPVWAAFVAHTCFNWGEYTFLTNIPTYLREVLLFDIKAVSMLCKTIQYNTIQYNTVSLYYLSRN